MAIEDMFDTVIARAVNVCRANSIMPRLVNHSTAAELTVRGGSVDIPVLDLPRKPTPIVPGPVPPASARPTPRNVALKMDFWEDGTFNLTDNDITSMANSADYIPKELLSSAAGIADRVDETILAHYKGVYGFAGAAGVTPFATSTIEAQQATRILSTQLCPKGMGFTRSLVLDEFAYANAIGLDVLQRVDASGSQITLREAHVGYALGFNWEEDQNMPTHITGAAGTPLINNAAGYAAGVSTIVVDGLTARPNAGDIFTIAGQTQTYTVLASTALASTNSTLTISPALELSVVDNAALSFRASHVVNLAFADQAFAFASRPMQEVIPTNTVIRRFVDDVSGLVLTLEMAREYYQTAFRLSCMWGSALVQPRFATRIAG